MTEERQIRIKSAEVAAPGAPIDGIHQAVRALYAYHKPAFYKELASAANLSPVYMSASLSSAHDVGLARLEGKRGLYALTDEGDEYGRLLNYGKDSECREMLRRIILSNPLWSEIIAFLKVSKGQAREPSDLVLAVDQKLSKRWSPSMRNRLSNNFTSILQFAGLITLEKGKMISQIGAEVETIITARSAMQGVSAEVEEKGALKEGTRRPEVPMAPASDKFVEFRLPDSFILYVRKDMSALEFFEQQVKEDSIFSSWLKFIKPKIKSENP